jgi:hypothetical protein
LARAEAALQRLVRAFQDGYVEPADYAQQRTELVAEREAAQAAAKQVDERHRLAGPDADDEVLQRLSDLRAQVLGKLQDAPDLDAFRTLLRQLFEAVYFLLAGHPCIERWELRADAPEVGGGAYLVPAVAPGIVVLEGVPRPGPAGLDGRRREPALAAGSVQGRGRPGLFLSGRLAFVVVACSERAFVQERLPRTHRSASRSPANEAWGRDLGTDVFREVRCRSRRSL